MNLNRTAKFAMLGMTFGLVAGIAALPAQAAELQTGGPGSVAVGAVEDSLSACLARIPKDASAGQRMMAEKSCRRDESGREIARNNPHQ